MLLPAEPDGTPLIKNGQCLLTAPWFEPPVSQTVTELLITSHSRGHQNCRGFNIGQQPKLFRYGLKEEGKLNSVLT